MRPIFTFLVLVIACLLYGLAFDSVINTVTSGQFCSAIADNICLIPAQLDRWLTIFTQTVILPAAILSSIHWFFSSRRRVSTLFGWVGIVS